MSGIQHTFDDKCKEHWNRMGYSKPEKLKERILEVFAKNTDQHYTLTHGESASKNAPQFTEIKTVIFALNGLLGPLCG